MMKGGDQFGKCRTISAAGDIPMSDIGDPTVNFGTDLVYGCGVSLNSQEFLNYCQNSQTLINQLEIFSNTKFFTKFGKFGNANIYNPKVSHLVSLLYL
jgi:hypothetical protein